MDISGALLKFGAQNGVLAFFLAAILVAAFWLVRYVLEANDAREGKLQVIIIDQNAVITRQSETIDSQSKALNRITDRIDDLCHSVTRLEEKVTPDSHRERMAV